MQLGPPGSRDGDGWFRALIDDLGDLVCRFRVDTTIVYANRTYAEYFGTTIGDLIGRSYLELVVEEQREAARTNTERLARVLTPASPVATTEHASARIGGQLRWLQWTDRALFDRNGVVTDFVSVGRDVTERRAAEAQAQHMANHDPLTGLVNRRFVLGALDRHSANAGSGDRALGVLFVDLDGFKQLNDLYGHSRGDSVLRGVADALRQEVRTSDIAGRLGGDEFVVLCPGCGGREPLEQLRDRLMFAFAQLQPPVAASIGAVLCESTESADEVLHRADQAMYEAKFARRGAARRSPVRRTRRPPAA